MKKIHLWLSLPAGLFITLICLTGAMLVFREEIVEITGCDNTREGFFHKIMTLHRWLMLPQRGIGRLIVGTSTIFLIIILITGIARWFRKPTFTFQWKSSWRRTVYDLHRVLGIYIVLILLLCAFTGLMWSFEWYRSGVAWLFGVAPEEKRAMMKTAYSLHVGSWGGIVTRWLTFFAALLGATLPITGYLLYWRRKK